jgi:hypothetical protein
MKLQLLTLCSLLLACSVVAQSVDFRNNQTDFPTTADRDVYCGLVGPLVGTNFQARLLYGTSPGSLQPATYVTPARFRNLTTGAILAGTWTGGNRTLAGFTYGDTVTLVVQVWDSTGELTFDQARAAGFLSGESAPFTYTIAGSGSAPTAFYMDNFRAFGPLSCIPEPSAIGLFLTAGLGWLVVRRRRR